MVKKMSLSAVSVLKTKLFGTLLYLLYKILKRIVAIETVQVYEVENVFELLV